MQSKPRIHNELRVDKPHSASHRMLMAVTALVSWRCDVLTGSHGPLEAACCHAYAFRYLIAVSMVMRLLKTVLSKQKVTNT